MKDVETKSLFSCENSLISPLLSEKYPWQILPKIKTFIEDLIENTPQGFKEISKNVLVGKDVNISSTATIEPPCIIGHNCEIRPGAYIRGSVIIGNNCVIGNSTELKNCILLNNVQVPHYNYVGDSILGNNSHLGAGTICSNLRTDKQNVVIKSTPPIETGLRKVGAFLGDFADVGCGCVLNPGTIIGKNTSIYPLTSVRCVVSENSIMKNPFTIIKKEH